LVKLTAKKTRCPKCEKLVNVKLQKVGERSQFCCIKCDTIVWQKEGLKWKYYRED
jgi:endogenous inhibitor of DNA gyrase (YacG/DUF329 family)